VLVNNRALYSWVACVLLAACAGVPTQDPAATAPTGKPVVVALAADADRARRAGDHEQAAEYIERALRIEPADAGLWYRLAEVRFAQGRYDQAVNFASKSNSLAGADSAQRRRNWSLIADAWQRLGQTEKADSARRKASAP